MLDVLIRGAMIVDGTGRHRFIGDVGIASGHIVEVADHVKAAANRTIDATGLVVCPGFIDVHSHDDLAVLHEPDLPYKLLQGVTTTVIGNCGHSVVPMPHDAGLRDELRQYMEPVLGNWESDSNGGFGYTEVSAFYDAIQCAKPSIHVGALVGHGSLRTRVMGFSGTHALSSEIEQMQRLLCDAMNEGALGLSLGLMYTPGCFAGQEELVALSQTVKSYDGIVTAHIRGEGDLLLPSIREMLEICVETGVSMHISHLKAVGQKNWGHVCAAIEMIRAARNDGLDVTCDAYPYAAGSTTLLSLLPPWVLQGGVKRVLERLKDIEMRQKIHKELEGQGQDWENVAYITGWDRVVLASSPLYRAYEGLSIAEISHDLAGDFIEAYFRVIEANAGMGTIVIHHMDESDVQQVLAFEHSAVGSDGLPSRLGHPHPRLYGTFPRFISKYVREAGILTLEEAIRKATSFTAERFKLGPRGRIQVGAIADITVFDYNRYVDVATYDNPKQFTPGLKYVFVNGKAVVDDGRVVYLHPGQLIRRENA